MPQLSNKVPRLLLVDDHSVVRAGVRRVLEEHGCQVVGEASDGHEAIRLSQELGPDIAVLDISLPLLNGIDSAREIAKVSPKTKIIVLSMYSDKRSVVASLAAGIVGFVTKDQSASSLIQAVDAVCQGGSYLSPSVSRTVLDAYREKADIRQEPLSVREREVLQLIAEGKNVKEIGSILGVSTKTAESHRTNIMHKLDIHDIPGLVRYSIREGLILPE